jgi:acyl carrier protein
MVTPHCVQDGITLELAELVASAISSACNIERSAIAPETPLYNLGVDSVSMMAVVAQVQMRYEVELTSDQIMELFDASRVEDAVSLLGQVIAQASKP